MKTEHQSKIGKGLVILIITVCLIPSIAFAFAPGTGGKRVTGFDQMGSRQGPLGLWRNAELTAEMGLTEDQVKKIQDADFTAREKRLTIAAELDKRHLEMDKAFSAATVDEAAVLKTAEKISDLRGKLFVQQIESRLALGKILTADQMEKLKTSEAFRGRKGPRPGQRQHRQAMASETD